jgi:hypothetical protein
VAFLLVPPNTQCWGFAGLAALDGGMIDPIGTTTCFGFLGFFVSLLLRNWPFAMIMLLAVASESWFANTRKYSTT